MTDHDRLPCRGKFCGRRELGILPLRIAYVPHAVPKPPPTMRCRLPSAMLHSAYGQGVYAGFRDGDPILRVITEGYVYIYDPRPAVGWRVFAATRTGHFMETPLADAERPQTQPEFGCTRDGHNLEASLIDLERPDEASAPVLMGYSRVWWTKSVRKRMLADAGLRDTFMVKLDAKALSGGASPDPATGFRIDEAGKALDQVLEYAGPYKLATVLYANTREPNAQDRVGDAAPLAKQLYDISPHGGIALGLPDPVGLAMDTDYWRNIKAGELAHFQVAEADARQHIVGELILGLEKSLKDNGQTAEWNKRYAPKLDMGKLNADKAAYDKKVDKLTQPIVRASDDWLNVVSRDVFWRAWDAYDGTDRTCGLAMEADFADSIEGSGALKKERQWWQPWLVAAPEDKKHPLWIALAAGDKSLLAYLQSRVGDGLDTYSKAREGTEEFKQWLEERQAKNLARSATDASGVIAGAIVTQLPRLIKDQPAEVAVIGARLRVLVAARTDTLITPFSMKTNIKQLVGMLYEAAWGPPKATMSAKIMETRRALITQDIGGGFVEGRFTSAKALELDLWLPESEMGNAQRQLGLDLSKALPSASAANALDTPLNPFAAMRRYLSTGQAKIVGLGAALALYNLAASLNSLDKALKAEGPNAANELRESVFGVVSGSLAVGAATMEVLAGVTKERVAGLAVKQAGSDMVLDLTVKASVRGLLGGVAGAAATWTEGIQDFMKSQRLSQDGDTDAATAYQYAGAMMLFSGAASVAASVITASSALAEVGATGSLATMLGGASGALTLGGAIPVWGWIALAIVALGVGIYLTFKAMTEEDTPLEVWLSRCYYRNAGKYDGTDRKLFANVKQSLAAFQQAVYGLQISFDWNDSWFSGKDEVAVQVIMPGYGSHSAYAYALQARGDRWGWNDIDSKTSVFSHDPDLQPHQRMAVLSAVQPGQTFIPMDEVIEFTEPFTFVLEQGMAMLKGKVALNPDYLNRARLKFQYWPDAANRPGLTLTPRPNGIDFQEVRD